MHSNQFGADLHFNRAMRRTYMPAIRRAKYENETVQQLTGTMFRILNELIFLLDLRRSRFPAKAAYVAPGQTYLANKCGVTREHICRCIKVLFKLGMLSKIRRRPEHGKYMTCLYMVTPGAHWLAGRLMNIFLKGKRVTNTSLKPTPISLNSLTPASNVPDSEPG